MNSMNLISDLMHLPASRGGILIWTLEPEEAANVRTDEIEISITVHVVQDAVDALSLATGAL